MFYNSPDKRWCFKDTLQNYRESSHLLYALYWFRQGNSLVFKSNIYHFFHYDPEYERYFYIPTNYTCVSLLCIYIIQKPAYPHSNFYPFLVKMENAALLKYTDFTTHCWSKPAAWNSLIERAVLNQGQHFPARTYLIVSPDWQGGACGL